MKLERQLVGSALLPGQGSGSTFSGENLPPTLVHSEAAETTLVAVVDDDESMRKAVGRLITSFGLGVEVFPSAEEFLDSAHYEDAACLILDVGLPGMSGLELQSRLVASKSDLPIIFITAHDDEAARLRALQAGAVDFLQKPFREEALLQAIICCQPAD